MKSHRQSYKYEYPSGHCLKWTPIQAGQEGCAGWLARCLGSSSMMMWVDGVIRNGANAHDDGMALKCNHQMNASEDGMAWTAVNSTRARTIRNDVGGGGDEGGSGLFIIELNAKSQMAMRRIKVCISMFARDGKSFIKIAHFKRIVLHLGNSLALHLDGSGGGGSMCQSFWWWWWRWRRHDDDEQQQQFLYECV